MMTSAGYDTTNRVLEIEFASGAVYHYFGVPPDVYQDLLDTPSQGQLFHNRIRGAFEFRRITDEVSAQ
jgi:hypothetical protein